MTDVPYDLGVIVVEILFWASLAALVWTHVAYPLVVRGRRALAGRVASAHRSRCRRVAVIVAAHNEETVIERRVENLLALDYPRELLEVVVTSDASTDRTEELAEAAGARVIRNPRGGKVAAQDRAVRETESEIVAFSDANATWAPDALRSSSRPSPTRRSPTSAGSSGSRRPTARTRRGSTGATRWRVRAAESKLGSVTGGNGSIYAVRRSDYVEVDPRFGHDLSLPYLMVQHGRRAVYEPAAHRVREADAVERDRVPAQGADVRALLADRAARQDAPRPAAGLPRRARLAPPPALRVAACSISSCSRPRSRSSRTAGSTTSCSRRRSRSLAAAAAGVGIARYYVLVTWATVVALWNYLRRGVPATWQAAEGTR